MAQAQFDFVQVAQTALADQTLTGLQPVKAAVC